MTTRKLNEWLEADLEDEENESGFAQEESRSAALTHSRKRIKTIDDRISEDEFEDENEFIHQSILNATVTGTPQEHSSTGRDSRKIQSPQPEDEAEQKLSKAQRALIKKRDTTNRSGVIYISHIPPFMKPHTLKSLLTPYAASGLGRVFLTPEDQDRRTARIKAGGNKKRNFVDGWVEFMSKKEAKIVVETLNTRTIGGKKGGYYFDDVWSMKYLKGFKWHHLTEQIATENAEREARMRAERAQSGREMKEFLRNVEKSKINATRKKKKGYLEEEVMIDDDSVETKRETKKKRSKGVEPITREDSGTVEFEKTALKIF
jgi:ESF2/ABP1 family protein